ncbi:MAG: hypothetical protein JST75_00395 [Bacteroidetes bacterium]|nr:hypothetical protein [Bacteroidota bacterium]
MMKRIGLSHVALGVLLLSFFSCSKELSNEALENGKGVAGSFRAKIDGASWVATNNISATVLTGLINITGTSSDGKTINISLLAGATGTYALDENSDGLASLNQTEATGPAIYGTNQSSDPAKSSGTVTITSIDQTNKTISGTFSFNGYDDATTVTKVVTEGVFDRLPYSSTLPPASITDTFKVKINGTSFTASSIAAPIVSGSFFVQGAASDGSNFVGLYMPENVQPGTYTLDIFGGVFVGQYSPDPSTLLVSMGDGTLTVIENNSTTKRIRGSFSFKAVDASNTQSAQLTEGYFSVGY